MKTKFNTTPSHHVEHLIDNVLNRSISDIMGTDFVSTQPSVNIIENPDNYALQIAAPGLEKSDFNIKVEKDQLIVTASKTESDEKNTHKFTRKEYNYSSFKRSFTLDNTIDTESIEATYSDGILSVLLHKKEEAKENGPQFINID